jgi:hypothetical protein
VGVDHRFSAGRLSGAEGWTPDNNVKTMSN